MAKTSELRRSCGLCRSRKIACSGETICKACRERSIECVYDLETPKGRPRSHKNDAAASNRSNVGDSDSAAASISISVMAELDVMFRENFGAEPVAAPSNLFHERVASFNRNLAAGKARHDASTPPGTLTYPAFLALLTQDLVETVAVKFGNLDCQPFFGPGERFYRACMLQDTIDSMFEASESLPCSSDVLDEYSPSLITQHLEVWFNNHPLSIIISKTLLLREIRNDSANQVLLGVLLADAHHFSDDSAREDRMLKWAISQLYLLSANKADIITAQITLLLGWYHACRCHSRRALCYIGYACRIATMLKCQLHESSSRNQTQINGIDHGAVEAEVIHNICWVALAITTWAFIQMDMSLADLLPAGLMQVLPVSTEADSMLLQLDRATHNLSTLKHQISSLQSVWLLSHVTSLSANMYALYPRLSSGRQPESHPWQDLVLRRLDHLLHQGRSLAQICSDSRDAILDVIALVQTQHLESKAASALLAFYHALSIQLLFPHGKDQSNCHPPVLSDILFQKLSKSMHGLKQLFPAIQSVAKQNAAQPTNIASAALHFYILALDATGRALAHILAKLAPGEQISWQDRLAHLFDAGSALHGLFDDDVLLQDHRWRSVKRQLKVACKKWQGLMAGFSSDNSRSLSSSLEPEPSSQKVTSMSSIPLFEDPFVFFNNTSSFQAQEDSTPGWPTWQQQLQLNSSPKIPTFSFKHPIAPIRSSGPAGNLSEPTHALSISLPSFSPNVNTLTPDINTQVEEIPPLLFLPESNLPLSNRHMQGKRSPDNESLINNGPIGWNSSPCSEISKRQRCVGPDTQNG